MRPAPRIRHLLTTALPAIIALGSGSIAFADPLIGTNRNSYGMPGAVDTPTAEVLPDATLSGSVGYSDYAQRNTLVFQAHPRITGVLRYSKLDGVDRRLGYLWDRSFDVHVQLLDEQGWRPAIAAGMRDFLGTGVYSAEYLVATKSITPDIRASVGIGWGRLAGAWRRTDYEETPGKLQADSWFRGDTKPFASLSWQATNSLSLVAEYSYDNYTLEVEQGADAPDSKLNLGINYRFNDAYQLSAYTIGGKTFGAQFTFSMSAKQAPYPSGLEPAPAPVRPRPAPSADPDGWSGAWTSDQTAHPVIQQALADAMAKEGQELQAMALSANRAEVRVENKRYLQQAEAIGRTARLMTRALPPSVETFVITSVENGLPTSSVTLRRSDIEGLENAASGEIARVAVVTDALPRPGDTMPTPGLYPDFRWSILPYASTGLFDPEDPFRYEVGVQAKASYELRPGLIVSGTIRQRAFGSMEQEAPGGMTVDEYLDLDSDIDPHTGVARVRSDSRMYSGNHSVTIPDLTLAWYAKPTKTVYTRVTAGLLERAFGGVSAEALWWPTDSRLAVGAEINRVRKRDFEGRFGFRDYETTTGHMSAYYDFGNGFMGQVDAGRYLAEDWGATVTVTREFANGWRVGGYFTKTDMSSDEFGEGSFDKGLIISIPLNWATGTPSQRMIGGNLRSLSRDGGTRLRVGGRLYDTVKGSQTGEVYEGWGRFWR